MVSWGILDVCIEQWSSNSNIIFYSYFTIFSIIQYTFHLIPYNCTHSYFIFQASEFTRQHAQVSTQTKKEQTINCAVR